MVTWFFHGLNWTVVSPLAGSSFGWFSFIVVFISILTPSGTEAVGLERGSEVGAQRCHHEYGRLPRPEDNDFYQVHNNIKLKCDLCGHKSESSAAFEGHKSMKHDLNIPHTAKWEKNKCHICNINFNKTEIFKNHLLENHGFIDDSEECMNCESIDVGLYLPAPQQYIVMNCRDCESEEED